MIKIELKTDNDAFGDSDYETLDEAQRILNFLQKNLHDNYVTTARTDKRKLGLVFIPLRDRNGNRVGEFTYEWHTNSH
jgi:hypothetical protein